MATVAVAYAWPSGRLKDGKSSTEAPTVRSPKRVAAEGHQGPPFATARALRRRCYQRAGSPTQGVRIRWHNIPGVDAEDETIFHVQLRVLGKTYRPAAITAMLGLEPTHSHALGDPITSRRSGEVIGARNRHYWLLETPNEGTLDDQIQAIATLLLPKAAVLHDLARTSEVFIAIAWGCTRLFVGRGIHLSASTLAAVAALGADLDYGVFCLLEHVGDEECGAPTP